MLPLMLCHGHTTTTLVHAASKLLWYYGKASCDMSAWTDAFTITDFLTDEWSTSVYSTEFTDPEVSFVRFFSLSFGWPGCNFVMMPRPSLLIWWLWCRSEQPLSLWILSKGWWNLLITIFLSLPEYLWQQITVCHLFSFSLFLLVDWAVISWWCHGRLLGFF